MLFLIGASVSFIEVPLLQATIVWLHQQSAFSNYRAL